VIFSGLAAIQIQETVRRSAKIITEVGNTFALQTKFLTLQMSENYFKNILCKITSFFPMNQLPEAFI
jgi:hypothetical protein